MAEAGDFCFNTEKFEEFARVLEISRDFQEIRKCSPLPELAEESLESFVPGEIKTNEFPYVVCKNIEDLKLFNAFGIVGSAIFEDKSHHNNLIGGFLSLFSLLTGEELTSGVNLSYYTGWGYNPKPIDVFSIQSLFNRIQFLHSETDAAFKYVTRAEERMSEEPVCIFINGDFSEKLHSLGSLSYAVEYTIAMCAIAYLLLFNKLTNEIFADWVSKKWKFFLKRLSQPAHAPNEDFFPSYDACDAFTTKIFVMFHARRQLFLGIREMAQTNEGPWSAVCKAILKFSKCTEMGHIRLINKYVFVDNPVLITRREVEGEIRGFLASLNFLKRKKIETADLPYFKVLYDDFVTKRFARKNYPVLWYFANKIGFSDSSTTEVYGKKFTENYRRELDKFIEEAIEMKRPLTSGCEKVKVLFEKAETTLAPFRYMLNALADPFTDS